MGEEMLAGSDCSFNLWENKLEEGYTENNVSFRKGFSQDPLSECTPMCKPTNKESLDVNKWLV